MTTYTTRFRLPLVTFRTRNWHLHMASMFAALDQSLGQIQTISLATVASVTLSTANNSSDQSRAKHTTFYGHTATRTVILPDIQRTWKVKNTGTAAVLFKAGSGANITVQPLNNAELITAGDTGVYSIDNGKDLKVIAVLVTNPGGSALVTGDVMAYFRTPSKLSGYKLHSVAASVSTQSSSGAVQIRIRNRTAGVSMLTTNITIDANESDTLTAATPAVIDGSNNSVSTGDQVSIDIIAAGTGAKGLFVETVWRPGS